MSTCRLCWDEAEEGWNGFCRDCGEIFSLCSKCNCIILVGSECPFCDKESISFYLSPLVELKIGKDTFQFHEGSLKESFMAARMKVINYATERPSILSTELIKKHIKKLQFEWAPQASREELLSILNYALYHKGLEEKS